MPYDDPWSTPHGFLNERADFLHVDVVRSQILEGWDVVVRVDGTYATKHLAELAAQPIVEALGKLVDSRRAHWLNRQRAGSASPAYRGADASPLPVRLASLAQTAPAWCS